MDTVNTFASCARDVPIRLLTHAAPHEDAATMPLAHHLCSTFRQLPTQVHASTTSCRHSRLARCHPRQQRRAAYRPPRMQDAARSPSGPRPPQGAVLDCTATVAPYGRRRPSQRIVRRRSVRLRAVRKCRCRAPQAVMTLVCARTRRACPTAKT